MKNLNYFSISRRVIQQEVERGNIRKVLVDFRAAFFLRENDCHDPFVTHYALIQRIAGQEEVLITGGDYLKNRLLN